MFYSNSSFWLYFCNTVALVLWENKILIKIVQKYMFQNVVLVFDRIWRPGLYFFDTYVLGGPIGEGTGLWPPLPWRCCGCCMGHLSLDLGKDLLPYGYLLFSVPCVMSYSPPKKAGIWSSFLQIPPIRTAFEVCWPLSPSTDARILQSQEPCISGDISIYLKTLFCSNPCSLHLNFRLFNAKYLVFHKSCKDGNLVGEPGFSPCFKFCSLKDSATR